MTVIEFPLVGTIGVNRRPKRYDIEIYQGDDFALTLVFKDATNSPINVTGWTALCEIEELATSTPAATPQFGTVIGGVNGEITITLSSLETEALAGGTYKYDLQVTDSTGKKRTYIGGKVTITEDISE